MLLDRQTPRVASTRAQVVLEMHQVGNEGAQVEIPPSREGVPQTGLEEAGKYQQIEKIRRPDLEETPDQKPSDVDRSALPELREQKPADQKPAQDEEEVNPGPSQPISEECEPSQPTRLLGIKRRMVPENQQDGHSAQDVELPEPLRGPG